MTAMSQTLFQAMEHLEAFINDCDRKVEVQKRKLKETQEELSEEAAKKVRMSIKQTNKKVSLSIIRSTTKVLCHF